MAHICNYLLSTASTNPSRPLFLPNTLPSQVLHNVTSLTTFLRSDMHVQLGDRVCLLTLTTAHGLEALLASTAAGCIAAPLNWRWTPTEAINAVSHLGATVIVTDPACCHLAVQVAASCSCVATLLLLGSPKDYYYLDSTTTNNNMKSKPSSILTSIPVTLRHAFSHDIITNTNTTSSSSSSSSSVSLLNPIKPPNDAAAIIFTSGTTSGTPKAALLSHTSLHTQSLIKLLNCHYSSSDTYLHTAPWYHIGGLSSALATLLAGSQHIFLPKFDPLSAVTIMQRYKVTAFIAVPTTIDDLISAAKQRWVAKLPCINKVLVGAGGLKSHQLKGLYSLAPRAVVHTAYGMTEATSSLTFDTPSSKKKSDTTSKDTVLLLLDNVLITGAVYAGRAAPGIEMAVLCEEKGGEGSLSVVKLHSAVGELLTRGPHVMLGYWQPTTTTTNNSNNNNNNSSSTIYIDGWFKTGDLGAIDTRGGIWLTGRVNDVIRTGSEGVSAWEVETCIASHPGIESAAVVGVPDDRLGEVVAAGVVLNKGWKWHTGGLRCQDLRNENHKKDGSSISATIAAAAAAASTNRHLPPGVVDGMDVQQYCRETCQLAGYKLPRVVMVFGGRGNDNDAMPTTISTGKVLKTEVKQRIVDALMDNTNKGVVRSRL